MPGGGGGGRGGGKAGDTRQILVSKTVDESITRHDLMRGSPVIYM